MSPIKKILKYFFHHSFSGEMVDRVHQRLAEPGDEREKEEVLREIWNEIGFPEADKRSEMAFTRLENTLDVRPRPCLRIPAWVRIAAIWLIPLLSLGVSYYLYRDARDVRQLAFMERFVPSGKRERITLPDGSEVWLNSGTLLLYPSDFIGDKREIIWWERDISRCENVLSNLSLCGRKRCGYKCWVPSLIYPLTRTKRR